MLNPLGSDGGVEVYRDKFGEMLSNVSMSFWGNAFTGVNIRLQS